MDELNFRNQDSLSMKKILDELEKDTLRWIKHHYWYYCGEGKDLPKDDKFLDHSIILADYKSLNKRVEALLPYEKQFCFKGYKTLLLLFTYKKILNTVFDRSSADEMHYRMKIISLFYNALVNIKTD